MPFPVWWTAYPVEAPQLIGWMGGPLAWELSGQSEEAFVSRAITGLASVMGMTPSAMVRRVRGSLTHNWMVDPYSRGAYSYESMIGGWTSEERYFRPGVFPSVSRSGNWEDVGHYTQMVWPTTTRVGCAIASNSQNDFLVCRYSPAGNVMVKRR